MSEINRILSINTIDGLLKYEITVKTILILAVISGLFFLAIISYFGGVKNTIEFCRSKLDLFLNSYGVKRVVRASKVETDKGIDIDEDIDIDKNE